MIRLQKVTGTVEEIQDFDLKIYSCFIQGSKVRNIFLIIKTTNNKKTLIYTSCVKSSHPTISKAV